MKRPPEWDIATPWRMLLTTAFMTCMLVGAMLSVKVVIVDGVPVPGGAFLFPFTYIIATVLAETYGVSTAQRMIYLGVGSLVASDIALSLVIAAPAASFSVKESGELQDLFGSRPIAFTVVATSFLIGQLAGLYTFRVIKRLRDGQLLWLRICGMPLIAQIVSTGISMPLLYGGQLQATSITAFFLERSLLSVIFSTAMSPLIMLAVWHIKRTEQPTPLPVE